MDNSITILVPCVKERTHKVVSALFEPSSEITESEKNLKFFQALKRAITYWINYSDEGQSAYKNSSESINVGDLSSDVDEDTLVMFLEREGITFLSIYTMDVGTDFEWSYDSLLFNPEDITI